MQAKRLLTLSLLGFVLLISSNKSSAQYIRVDDYDADSAFFIGGSSVALLKKGKVELNAFAFLNSFVWGQRKLREASPLIDYFRNTSFASRLDAYIGMSEKARWDLGFRVEYMRSRLDNAARNSLLDIFSSNDRKGTAVDNSFGGISRVGLRFRVKPFPKLKNFMVLGGYSVGALKSPVLQDQLRVSSDQIDLGLNFYKSINPRVFYYFNFTSLYDPTNREDTVEDYSLSLTGALINLSLNNRFAIYPGLNYTISLAPALYTSSKGLRWTSRNFSGFVGGQVQLSSKFLLNASYTIPIINEMSNAWAEVLPRTQTTFSLSSRILF